MTRTADRPDDLPSIAEVAALTARLRALSNAGTAADPVVRARFLADKDALIDRIAAADRAYELASRADDTASDNEAIGPAEPGLAGAEGPPIDAGPALTAEEAAYELAADGRGLDEARALVGGYLDDVSERVGASAHLWGLDEADLNAIRSASPPVQADVPAQRSGDETARRDQLAAWDSADTADVDDAADSQEVTR